MKIAWFSPYGKESAIGKFSSLVGEALAARGYAITLVSSDADHLSEYCRPPEGIELIHWSRFEMIPEAAEGYDLFVYNVGSRLPCHTGILKLIDRFPGVCIFHDFQIRSASQAPMTGWLARRALAAVAHAGFHEDFLAESSTGPVRLIPFAYAGFADLPQISTESQNGLLRILTVGRVNRDKRVEAVIETIASSALLRGRCEYDVIGEAEPGEAATLNSTIDKLGLGGAVRLHGAVGDEELRWRYAEADIVCSLRYRAVGGVSATCLEAMAYGKVVIATETEFSSAIPSDCILRIRPANEIEDLTRHLETLVAEERARQLSLGARARQWIEMECDPGRYAERLEPLLEAAMEQRPASDALKQITVTLRAMGVQAEEPIVRQIGSDFQSLFRNPATELEQAPSSSQTGIDLIKSISNMLREPVFPAENKPRLSDDQHSADPQRESPPVLFEAQSVVIVGSGGHAKVVIELVRAEGKYQIAGCTGLGEEGFVLGDVPILGTDTALPEIWAKGARKAFVAIGDNHHRMRVLAQVSEEGFELINAISPHAIISPSALLGRGIAIMAGAVINASVRVGDGAIINTNTGLDHDCLIGDGAHVGPGSALAGNVKVGCEAFIGVGASVLPGTRIGDRAIIGAGSVVNRDIPDDVIAMGVPARIVRDRITPD